MEVFIQTILSVLSVAQMRMYWTDLSIGISQVYQPQGGYLPVRVAMGRLAFWQGSYQFSFPCAVNASGMPIAHEMAYAKRKYPNRACF